MKRPNGNILTAVITISVVVVAAFAILVCAMLIWQHVLEQPDPASARIIRTGPAPVTQVPDHPYPKRPCPDCLLKHKLGACLTNQPQNERTLKTP